MYSKEYLQWVKDTKQKNLTNNQHKFAEFLLENHKMISMIGSYTKIFISIRDWVKNNQDLF